MSSQILLHLEYSRKIKNNSYVCDANAWYTVQQYNVEYYIRLRNRPDCYVRVYDYIWYRYIIWSCVCVCVCVWDGYWKSKSGQSSRGSTTTTVTTTLWYIQATCNHRWRCAWLADFILDWTNFTGKPPVLQQSKLSAHPAVQRIYYIPL